MAPLPRHLRWREDSAVIDDGSDDWWFSPTAYYLRWGVCAFIMLAVVLLLTSAYHAKRRMRVGLAPLAYHRWLVPKRERLQFQQNPLPFYDNREPDIALKPYAAPPPVYDEHQALPPSYQQQEGGDIKQPLTEELPAGSASMDAQENEHVQIPLATARSMSTRTTPLEI